MRRALIALAIVTGSRGAAGAGPAIATVEADLDGNKTTERIRLEADRVVVEGDGNPQQATSFSLGAAVRGGTLAAGGGWIAIEVQRADGREGIGLTWKPGAIAVGWRDRVGPVGVDGEYRIGLTATAQGLVRYQARPDVRRCDKEPALLFAEVWSASKKRFVPLHGKPHAAGSAKPLKATRDKGPPPRSAVFAAREASTAADARNAGELVAPQELDDGDVKRAWRARPDDGIGAFITYRARVAGSRAKALWLAPDPAGDTSGPAKLGVVGADRAYWVEVPAGADPMRVDLPEPIADCVTIVIGDVHKRGGKKATSIGELVVLGEADLAPGGAEAALVDVVVAGGEGVHGASQQLVQRGATGADAVIARLAGGTVKERDARRRLWKILIVGKQPTAAKPLAGAIVNAELTGPDLDGAAAAIATMPGAVTALAEIARGGETTTRIAAIEGLGRITTKESLTALLAITGERDREVRKAVITALAKQGTTALLDAAAPAAPAGAADVLRAIGLAAVHASAADRARALKALVAALASAQNYDVRYRAIQGVGTLGDAAAVKTLDGTLRALPAGGRTDAMHHVASLALVANRTPEASALLGRLATHTNPGVRLSAMTALAERDAAASADDATDRVLVGVLAKDRWPELRSAAASALGVRCQRPGPARALDTAVGSDADYKVRSDALAALVNCRAKGITDRLMKIAVDGKMPLPVRERAVGLLVVLEDCRVEQALIGLFERWRAAAFDSTDALVLARRATVALGKLGCSKASGAALEAALGDTALPELVASAAAALGDLGANCPRSAIPTLRELATSDQRVVSLAARRAIKTCGK